MTLLHGPRRFPHVQLEITFATRDYLDAEEDEHALGSARRADGQGGVEIGGEGLLQGDNPATPVPDGPATPGKRQAGLDDEFFFSANLSY